jgi:hypothetical protein
LLVTRLGSRQDRAAARAASCARTLPLGFTIMQERLLFLISPPRSGSTLLQRMLGSHSQVFTFPEPHLITPLAFLGYHDLVDKAPFDHINAAEAIKTISMHCALTPTRCTAAC